MASRGSKRVSITEGSPHNLVKGLWQLSRLHTFEGLSTASIGWLALFFYSIQQHTSWGTVGSAFLGLLASYMATHAIFCMWNDICDKDFDAQVARTRKRPLPSGMVTMNEALVAFFGGLVITVAVTFVLLGERVAWAMGPPWVLSFIYPLCKRVVWAPQVVLGLTMASCVLPPWVALGNDYNNNRDNIALPTSLFGAIFSWLVYLDLIYASQDRPDDEKAGVKSLVVFLGKNLKLGLAALGVAQIAFFAQAAFEASASRFLWLFGVLPWTISVPWSILSLDPKDRNSGGRIFLFNAVLVLYLTAVAGTDIWVSRR